MARDERVLPMTRVVCQLERAYIFSALEKKSRVYLGNKRKRDRRNIGL